MPLVTRPTTCCSPSRCGHAPIATVNVGPSADRDTAPFACGRRRPAAVGSKGTPPVRPPDTLCSPPSTRTPRTTRWISVFSYRTNPPSPAPPPVARSTNAFPAAGTMSSNTSTTSVPTVSRCRVAEIRTSSKNTCGRSASDAGSPGAASAAEAALCSSSGCTPVALKTAMFLRSSAVVYVDACFPLRWLICTESNFVIAPTIYEPMVERTRTPRRTGHRASTSATGKRGVFRGNRSRVRFLTKH